LVYSWFGWVGWSNIGWFDVWLVGLIVGWVGWFDSWLVYSWLVYSWLDGWLV